MLFCMCAIFNNKSKVKVAQLYPTLCNPMDYTVHGILQAGVLEWVAVPGPSGSSQARNRTRSPALQADSLPAKLPGKPIYDNNDENNHNNTVIIIIIKEKDLKISTPSPQLSTSCPYRRPVLFLSSPAETVSALKAAKGVADFIFSPSLSTSSRKDVVGRGV